MAPFKIKREADLDPPPRKGLGCFQNDSENMGTSSAHDSFAKPAPKPLIPDPNWKQCERENRLERVKIKEQAARMAVSALKKMLNTLRRHLLASPLCQTRIDKIHEILARKKEFQVQVGFLGATGAGKTTLLDAIIGYKDLLPSSIWRASTAVPTEVSYNKSLDKDKLFRAEVVYITQAEWREELESLFEDLRATDEDNEIDEERIERINQGLDKIKYIYPRIDTRQKLESASVEDLLTEVRDVLGSTRLIEKHIRSAFSNEIRQYIDSGEQSSKKTPHWWPLIKLCRVFVKSSVLEPGVILVDLPGNLDSNAARSAVAENYSKNLALTCIVADVSRGISEKNAAELLEKYTKRNLQLDGLYNSDSLCFVLSKTDRSFDYAQYVKQYPELGNMVSPDIKKAWKLKGDISGLERQNAAVGKSHKKNKMAMAELSANVKNLTSRLKALSSASTPFPSTRKRTLSDTEEASTVTIGNASEEHMELRTKIPKLEKELSELKTTTEAEAEKLLSFGRRIAHLEKARLYARSRLTVQCIRHRNELSRAAIRTDYETTLREMGRQPVNHLQVFPVSATVYLMCQSSGKRHIGFPNREDTHISALRDWILGTTLGDRERYAQAFLDDVDDFLASNQPWIMGKYGESKMSPELREQWEPHMESLVADLEADLRNLTIKTEATLKHIVQTNVYSVVPQAVKSAGAKARDTAEKWARTCHWATHKKINSKRGLWTDSKGRDHKWNHELVHDLTTHIVKPWDLTFYRQFPQEKINYIDAGKVLVSEFSHAIANKDIFPDASDGIDVLKDHILRIQNRFRNDTDTAFDEMKKVIKKAHKLAVPAVKGFLEEMYEHCASESGRGFYARNRIYIDNFMTSKGVPMHRMGKKAIKSELDQLLDNVPARLGQGNALILQQIREEIKQFFDRNSTDGSRISSRKVVSNAKLLMQKDILVDINNLAKDWKLPVQDELFPNDDETEDEMTFDDDLFVDFSKDDDDDYSDGEAD